MDIRRTALLAAVIAGAALVTACNPTLRSHGFRYPDGEAPTITPGEDTRASLLAALGTPSARGVFDDDTWYYISPTREYLAYLRPDTRERRVIAVRFAADGSVGTVDEYGLEDGRVVALVERITPTRGRELSLIEQLLGNVGNFNPGQFIE